MRLGNFALLAVGTRSTTSCQLRPEPWPLLFAISSGHNVATVVGSWYCPTVSQMSSAFLKGGQVLWCCSVLRAGERQIAPARTFSDVAPGTAFWYENANGLAEIAVNCGRADETLGLTIGSEIYIEAG